MYITRSRKKRIHHLTTITKITKGGGVLTDTYSGKESGTKKSLTLPLGHPACVDSKYENGGATGIHALFIYCMATDIDTHRKLASSANGSITSLHPCMIHLDLLIFSSSPIHLCHTSHAPRPEPPSDAS